MSEAVRVLSFGGGVQTVTLAAMACLGDYPMPDFAVFGDTGWELTGTREYLNWFMPWAKERGLVFRLPAPGDIRGDALDPAKRFASMPLHTENGIYKPDGGKEDGILRRQCTREYKVTPCTKETRLALGYEPGQRVRRRVELLFGITLDEAERMRDNRERWITNRYPFIDMGWRRGNCVEYLKAKNLPIPPKSACVGCPMRSNAEWRRMKREAPKDWEDACAFDDAIRRVRVELRHPIYLHRSLKPLREVYLEEDQSDLFGNECEGYCGT